MKKRTILAVDIGNSDTVFGLFLGKKLIADWRMKTRSRSSKQISSTVAMLLEEGMMSRSQVDGGVIASVVPHLTPVYERSLRAHLRTRPVVVKARQDLGIRIRYRPASALGADRICHALGAWDAFGGPTIVIDFGTATTIDVISARGEFLGGLIAPGIQTGLRALSATAAKLPEIDLHFPPSLIAQDTLECMQSGVLNGAVAFIEGILPPLKKLVGRNARVLATGGFAPLIASQCRVIDTVDTDLVLQGARVFFERVRKAG